MDRNFKADVIGAFMTEIASFSSYKEGELDNMKQRVENVARIGGIVEETRQEMA